MTKDVIISISGIHSQDGEDSDVGFITTGNHYIKNGAHYFLYDEIMEEVPEAVKNTVKIKDGGMEIMKRGGTAVHMVFRQGQTVNSRYVTPYGEMTVGITTDKIGVEEEEDRLCVKVEYFLDVNYEHVSRCSLVLEARSKAV